MGAPKTEEYVVLSFPDVKIKKGDKLYFFQSEKDMADQQKWESALQQTVSRPDEALKIKKSQLSKDCLVVLVEGRSVKDQKNAKELFQCETVQIEVKPKSTVYGAGAFSKAIDENKTEENRKPKIRPKK